MKSMTGYGKAKFHENDIDLEMEIKSINGRYLELRLYIPREISFFEYTVRKRLSSSLSRGTIEVRTNLTDHREPRINLNATKLKKYYEIVQAAKQTLNLEDEISLEFLLKEPGIIESANDLDEDIEILSILDKTLEKALSELIKSLSAEAENMKETLSRSISQMSDALKQIESQIKPFKEELYENLKKRIVEIMQSTNNENLEQRLFQELAIYIDKYDIHEELSRLRSHLETFRSTMNNTKDNGKSLNFVLQEMQREANTLGSKFSTPSTFEYILVLKEEIEKCREIVQNVA
ncbi:MAG: YicC/YloC family endoribonuclease [Candidatus Syntrophosphaera sp.]